MTSTANSALLTLPEAARDVLISVNPNAGWRNNREIVDQLISQLTPRGFSCSIHTQVDELANQARELQTQHRLRAVVAAGGDGTMSLVAERTAVNTPLAILPLGTENLLAKYLGIQCSPKQVARIIATGKVLSFDAGIANGKLFSLMVGCGLDADVVQRMHAQRRGQIVHWSYIQPILAAVRHYSYPQMTVYYQQWDAAQGAWIESSLRGKWVFVINLPRYAGGLNFAPQANGQDGLLDVCVFEAGSLGSGLLYLAGVLLGRHQSFAGFHLVRTPRVRIEAESQTPFQCDGDPGGMLPVEISVVPQRLSLLVDESWAERHLAAQ